ncbi:MAG: hypothetical protein PVF71_01975, partial [Desulfobacterales bacterium]
TFMLDQINFQGFFAFHTANFAIFAGAQVRNRKNTKEINFRLSFFSCFRGYVLGSYYKASKNRFFWTETSAISGRCQ